MWAYGPNVCPSEALSFWRDSQNTIWNDLICLLLWTAGKESIDLSLDQSWFLRHRLWGKNADLQEVVHSTCQYSLLVSHQMLAVLVNEEVELQVYFSAFCVVCHYWFFQQPSLAPSLSCKNIHTNVFLWHGIWLLETKNSMKMRQGQLDRDTDGW